MKPQMLLTCCIATPLIGAVATLLGNVLSKKLRNAIAFVSISASFILSLALISKVLVSGPVNVSIAFPLGFDLTFTADALAVFMALVSSFISSIIVLYSFDYISHYPNQGEYYFMVTLFLGSMMGLVFSANLISLYIFWEMTAIASWRLIGFFREKEYVLRADKALLITAGGAMAMLAGILIIYSRAGTFDMAALKIFFSGTTIPDIAVFLILIGILTKSATLPFHTWLPDAGVAPSPVTALLHAAVLVKIGVYVFARLFISTFAPSYIWHVIIPAIAATSALVAAGAALVETDMKRVIAYSTVSQIGFIFLGFASGSAIGIYGALLFILMHGLAKGGLFLCAGIVEQNTNTKDITKMGGLIKTMPITAIAFLACAFSVMGIPPFGGFFSKYLIFYGAVSGTGIFITIAFLLGAILTILYLLRLFKMIFLGDTKIAISAEVKEGSVTMIVSVVILAALSLAAGIFISFPAMLAQATVKQMLGI